MREEWRDIPGYGGRYQISDMGRVRSMFFRNHPRRKPLLLNYCRRADGSYIANLTDTKGCAHQHTVTRLMAVTWLGMKWKSKNIAYCKNGMKTDLALENIGIRKAGTPKGEGSNRKPVRKILRETGEIIAVYGSVEEAAAKNYMSVGCMLNRLKKRKKKPEDVIFEYDENDIRGIGRQRYS